MGTALVRGKRRRTMFILGSILIVLLLLSVTIGFLVVKRGVTLGFRVDALAWPSRASTIAAFSILVGGGTILALIGTQKVVPTSDASTFQKRDRFGVSREQVTITRQQICSPSPFNSVCTVIEQPIVKNLVLAIEFPVSVPLQKDFVVSLDVESKPDPLPKGRYSAVLFAPKHVEVRTINSCKDVPESPNATRSCGEIDDVTKEPIRLVWTATPTKTGEAIISITSDLIARLSDRSAPPSSQVKINVGRDGAAQELKVADTRFPIGDALIDLTNKEIRFSIKILTSLGVSQETYDWIKVIAGIVAALGTLLGAGFATALLKNKRSGSHDATD
jgi:hypothetical protein